MRRLAVRREATCREAFAARVINARQRRIVHALLDGFEGKLTSSKYAGIDKCSQDTATRDLDDLVARSMLAKDPAGGRSTRRSLAESRIH